MSLTWIDQCLTERKFMFLSTVLCRSRQAPYSRKVWGWGMVKYNVWELYGKNLHTSAEGNSAEIHHWLFGQQFIVFYLLLPLIATRQNYWWIFGNRKALNVFEFIFWCTWSKKKKMYLHLPKTFVLHWIIIIYHESVY